jgi:predicted permease
LVRQLITEGFLLAAAGGVAGLLTAVAVLPLLVQLVPTSLPLGGSPSINLRVLLFAAAVTLATSLLFAVAPALRLGDQTDAEELRGGNRGGGGRKERLRAMLVTVEVAASVVLLVGAGLLMRAIQRIQAVDPGWRTEEVYTIRTALPSPRYAKGTDRERFYRDVLAQVKALPGVSDAAYVTCLPIVCGGLIWPVGINGLPTDFDEQRTASLRYVTPGYFSTLGIPLRRGRDVSDQDHQGGPPVAVVSESFAERFWPGEDPLGRRFTVGPADREVVGVVADIKTRGLERVSEPQVFLPANQIPDFLSFYWPKDLAIRTTQGAATLLPSLTRIVQAVDRDQPVSNPRTLTEIVASQTTPRAVQLRVLGALAGVALLLASVGIHGLLSFMVSQRSREIGVRMALGARTGTVIALVLGRGMAMAAAGIVVGAILAYLAARAIRAALFGVPAADPLTFTVVVSLCLLMTLIGSLMPALRATRVDPLRSIRAE